MSLDPPLAIITGSRTIFDILSFLIALSTDLMTSVECSIPILIAFGLISLQVNKI